MVLPASTAAVLGRPGRAAVPVQDKDPRGSPGTPVEGNPGVGSPVVGSPAQEVGPAVDIPEQTGQCTEGAAQNSSLR